MIGRLTGRVVECAPGEVLLDVAGVGYALQIPLATYYVLAQRADRDAPATLHVHTWVREDAIQLYGFAGRDERELFELLISISGVGPRLALAILSGIGAGELRTVVEREDRARLVKIPGVGKKTAERLLLELRDKLTAGARRRRRGIEITPPPADEGAERSGLRADAVSALLNIGYADDVAERAVRDAMESLDGAAVDLRGLLKIALGRLAR